MWEYRDYHKDFSFQSEHGKWSKRLIILHAIMFAVQIVIYLISQPFYWKFLNTFGLVVKNVIGSLYIWQVFTYMLLHAERDPFHILFNMLVLYFFGPELESRLGHRRFLFVYFFGGIMAGVAYVLIYAFSMQSIPVIGASGAVMSVMVLYALYYPYRTILFFFVFPMQIKTAVTIIVLLDLYYSIMAPGGGIAHVAHLGGALFGYIFYRHEVWFINFLEGPALSLPWSKDKEEAHDENFEKTLDEILEKVHKEGISSLSRSEKKFLQKASQKYKDQDK